MNGLADPKGVATVAIQEAIFAEDAIVNPNPPENNPNAAPTVAPTAEPTVAPTVEPTTAPTVEPTAAPTVEPTTAPTVEPTTAPTVEPTVEPTAAPTVAPTAAPDPATVSVLSAQELADYLDLMNDAAVQAQLGSTFANEEAAVKWLQQTLKDLGEYSGQINGVYNQATLNAVKAYQQAKGILPAESQKQGRVDQATFEALYADKNG